MTLQQDPGRNEIRYLRRFADLRNKQVLEIGCGEGRLTWQYARETRSLTAIDIDAAGLRVASIERPSDLQSRVHFARVDSEYLPFSKEAFDIAILSWSL